MTEAEHFENCGAEEQNHDDRREAQNAPRQPPPAGRRRMADVFTRATAVAALIISAGTAGFVAGAATAVSTFGLCPADA